MLQTTDCLKRMEAARVHIFSRAKRPHPDAFLKAYRYVGSQIAYEMLGYSTPAQKQIR